MPKKRSMRPLAILFALITAFTTLALTNPASAQTSVDDLQIVEGQGIGDVITIGQTRADLIATLRAYNADNGNCDDATECLFFLSGDTAALRARFDSSDRVEYIKVNQGGTALDKRWETTAGVNDDMAPADVAALYPGSVTTSYLTTTHVAAEAQGYTYNLRLTCYRGCQRTVWHEIYAPNDNGGGGEVVEASFEGEISVYNRLNRNRNMIINVTITDPNGDTTEYSTRERVQRRSTYTIDPADILPTDGPLGEYSYDIELRRAKNNNLVGTNSGTFSLNES